MDGYRAYIRAHDERPAHVEPVEGPSTIQEVGNQQDLAADGTETISEVRALIERHLPASAHPT
jgi:hypothetical protein